MSDAFQVEFCMFLSQMSSNFTSQQILSGWGGVLLPMTHTHDYVDDARRFDCVYRCQQWVTYPSPPSHVTPHILFYANTDL